MCKIYFISGLGADERVFQSLSIEKSHAAIYIKWFEPFTKETLVQYVERLKVQINQDEAYILLGVLFGGIVA